MRDREDLADEIVNNFADTVEDLTSDINKAIGYSISSDDIRRVAEIAYELAEYASYVANELDEVYER